MKKITIIFLILTFSFFIKKSVFAAESFIITGPNRPISVGEIFTVSVFVSSPNQPMNATSGAINVTGGASIVSTSKQGSIINFWTNEPGSIGNTFRFEGVVMTPGYQGQNGKIFSLNLLAKKEGTVNLAFTEGALLANDGLGSNIIDSLPIKTFRIVNLPVDGSIKVVDAPKVAITTVNSKNKVVALPVITEYSDLVDPESRAFIKGKGEPSAITKLSFKDISTKSLGEQFISALQTKKKAPNEALVKNDEEGFFQYITQPNLVAGSYNVTPFLVEEETDSEKPGFGVQVLVNNSKLVKFLVVLINILALLIPIVCLVVIIYFIPWYSRLKMKILNHKMKLEEEKISLSEREIKKKEELS